MNAQEAIALAAKKQQEQAKQGLNNLDIMPDMPPFGTLDWNQEMEARKEWADILDSQMAHKATSNDSLMTRARICGVIALRLEMTFNPSTGKPNKVKPLRPGQVARILMGLATFANIGTNEQNVALHIYNPESGIYEERPLFLGRLVNIINPDALRRDRLEVADRISNELPPVTPDKNPNWVVLKNGVLDVITKELHPFSPRHIFISKTAAEWDPSAAEEPSFGPDKWKLSDALTRYFDGNDDEIRAFYHVVQLALLTNKPSKVFIYFYSKGGQTGKGTLIDLLINLVGKENSGAANLETLESRFGLAGVWNKSLIYGNENDQVFCTAGNNNLKMLATGDGLTVDRKNNDAITVNPTPLVVQSMNSEPQFYNLDGGIKARMRIFTFVHSFTDNDDEDVNVRESYIHDPKLLRWLTRKVLMMDVPDRMPNFDVSREMTDMLEEDSNPVRGWINERFNNFNGDEFPIKLLYVDFRSWCLSQGIKERSVLTRKKFTKTLRDELSLTHSYDAKHGTASIGKDTINAIKEFVDATNPDAYVGTDIDAFMTAFVKGRGTTIKQL